MSRNGGVRSVSLLETVPLVRTGPDGFHKSALALIEAGTVWRKKIAVLSNLRILFHIANDGLPTVVHMNVLDPDKLLAGVVAAPVQELPAVRLGVVEHPPPPGLPPIRCSGVA